MMSPEGVLMQERDGYARLIAERAANDVDPGPVLIEAYVEARDALHRLREERQQTIDAESTEREATL